MSGMGSETRTMRLLMLCAIGTLGGILMASADKKARRLHEEQVSMDEKLKQLDQKA
ncbi:hypothetical protein MPTK1_5g23070 [Marchantia polymorpha subsp. ruderalis]|uniref:Uncharacterized protein n=2 Tax=Marchantia polymorpha TaxID=3197 RepID=A0AAF6BLC6_MARPO|nr:hypothetical protein MARPO_0010s0149 [Marchantia polymorpha]BBN12810.1 hypothetical protein Mp_5g23070 [Marchantia polymorpha subsp. ruderalis]|eukprot:PTQ46768.1 hypothetical protein MARPO_0010s0149 [Marchantia polymorpha]